MDWRKSSPLWGMELAPHPVILFQSVGPRDQDMCAYMRLINNTEVPGSVLNGYSDHFLPMELGHLNIIVWISVEK